MKRSLFDLLLTVSVLYTNADTITLKSNKINFMHFFQILLLLNQIKNNHGHKTFKLYHIIKFLMKHALFLIIWVTAFIDEKQYLIWFILLLNLSMTFVREYGSISPNSQIISCYCSRIDYGLLFYVFPKTESNGVRSHDLDG